MQNSKNPLNFLDQNKSVTPAQWQLYGTLGCHLCDDVEMLLQQALMVKDFSYQKIDIMDLADAKMQALAEKIPVLVTPNATLCYPFSLMDIMAL